MMFDGYCVVVDTGPDFRQQVLQSGINRLNAVLYTHAHADHTNGFDDLRAFSFYGGGEIPCYILPEYIEEMKLRFGYAFCKTGYRGATPSVALHPIKGPFKLFGKLVEPLCFPHGSVNTCGFKIGNFAYVTDFKLFSDDQKKGWAGKVKVMIASGLHFDPHASHSNIPETIQLFEDLGVEKGILTHLSHKVLHAETERLLPDHVNLAYDGLVVDVGA
tara:strand:+ start:313 stop:963 length:651 start_codon:yes stop_codon:yes gene_type:complete